MVGGSTSRTCAARPLTTWVTRGDRRRVRKRIRFDFGPAGMWPGHGKAGLSVTPTKSNSLDDYRRNHRLHLSAGLIEYLASSGRIARNEGYSKCALEPG